MKRQLVLAAAALALAACVQTTAPVSTALASTTPRSPLRFRASCASVWDISVDGRDSGPLLFMSTAESYDLQMGSGTHNWSATRWAPSDVGTEQGTVTDAAGADIVLRCS